MPRPDLLLRVCAPRGHHVCHLRLTLALHVASLSGRDRSLSAVQGRLTLWRSQRRLSAVACVPGASSWVTNPQAVRCSIATPPCLRFPGLLLVPLRSQRFNPSLFELDRAGECATAMASSGDPRMAQGSNRPRMHYRLIVRPGLITLKKPSKLMV